MQINANKYLHQQRLVRKIGQTPDVLGTMTLGDHDFVLVRCTNKYHDDYNSVVWHTFDEDSATLEGGDINWATPDDVCVTMDAFGVQM